MVADSDHEVFGLHKEQVEPGKRREGGKGGSSASDEPVNGIDVVCRLQRELS